MQSSTAQAGTIVGALDGMTNSLRALAQEQNVSEVLLLTLLKDYTERRLTCVLQNEGINYGPQ